jgi:hypothetical protein
VESTEEGTEEGKKGGWKIEVDQKAYGRRDRKRKEARRRTFREVQFKESTEWNNG